MALKDKIMRWRPGKEGGPAPPKIWGEATDIAAVARVEGASADFPGAPIEGSLVYRSASVTDQTGTGITVNTTAINNATDPTGAVVGAITTTDPRGSILATPGYVKIGNEIVKITTVGASSITFATGGRGARGTTAASHETGVRIMNPRYLQTVPSYGGAVTRATLQSGNDAFLGGNQIAGICTIPLATSQDIARYKGTPDSTWRNPGMRGGGSAGFPSGRNNYLIEVQPLVPDFEWVMERLDQTETVELVPGQGYAVFMQTDGTYVVDVNITQNPQVIFVGYDDVGLLGGLTPNLATSGTRACPIWVRAASVQVI